MEASFGRTEGDGGVLSVRHPEVDREIRIKGSIDRVDAGAGKLRVLDYKRTIPDRSDERHFQLPIYLAAALRDHGEDVDTVRAMWAGLRQRRRPVAEDIPTNPDEFFGFLRRTLWKRIERLEGGDVSPDPSPISVCKACDLRRLCLDQ